MSRVKELEIQGVRNFGDESAKATIRFYRPLTLILGPNGSGKTTIIEALKYMSSGEYPPDSDRGKSFVHEPKLTSSHTVRGQVKGKIIDKKGQEVVVTRAMQVSRKNDETLRFQKLNSTITRYDKKTKQGTPSNEDVDRAMLDAMGVSKAILNHVIFCHQEESNWPLEDAGKKLKDRFDEIFNTSKYNRAMDDTNELINKMQTDLKVKQADENGLKAIVEKVRCKEDELKDTLRREQSFQDRIKKIKEITLPIDKEMQKILDIKEKHQRINDKLKSIETNYKQTNDHIVYLKKRIKNIHERTKKELIEKIESFDTNYTQKSNLKKENEDKLTMLQNQEKELYEKLTTYVTLLGSFQQKKRSFAEKVRKRNELLNKCLSTLDIIPQNSILTENKVTECINYVKTKVGEFKLANKSKIQDYEKKERHIQKELNSLKSEISGIDSVMSSKQKDQADIKREILDIEKTISQTEDATSRLQNIESQLQIVSQQHENSVKGFNENEMEENLKKTKVAKNECDARVLCIDQEISSLNSQNILQTELEMHQGYLKRKEADIELMMSKHKNNLEIFFSGKEIPQRKLKYQLDFISTNLSKQKNDATKIFYEKQQKLTALKTNLKYNEKECERKRLDLEAFKGKVYVQCKDIEYEKVLMLQEKKVKSLQDKRGIYANRNLLYEEFLKEMKQKSCCPLCERDFAEGNDEKQLKQRLLTEIKKSPQSLEECTVELKKEQAQYDTLQQLKTIIEQIKEMETVTIPKLESLIAKDKLEFQKAEEALREMRLALLEPEQQLSIYKTINSDITLLDNYLNEKENLISIINNKKEEMSKAGKIGNRGIKEAQNELKALKEEIRFLDTRQNQFQCDLEAGKKKVQKAREQKNDLNEKVLKLRQDMQDLNQSKAKLNDLYENEKSLDVFLRESRKRLDQANENLASKDKELKTVKQKNDEVKKEGSNFISKCDTELQELTWVQADVEVLINDKIEVLLLDIETSEKKISKELEKKKQEKEALEEDTRVLEEQCKSQKSGKQDLEDNLELMMKQESIKVVEEEISKYKAELNKLQYDTKEKEYNVLQKERESYEKEINTKEGTLSELKNKIEGYKQSLNSDEYRMARHNYTKNRYALIVQEETIANLKLYLTVLDKAMIQFHEERMNTVNKIMKSLWKEVYGGNDTHSIQIRVQTTDGIGDKRRSYNYKLVQVKRSTKMDMKGKCSAGQKVLASIIIRMALAKTFCTDCAVLALDEPTTNLDEENANNLAVALSNFIRLQAQHNKNFQLIVISHDEKFISTVSNKSGKQIFQELYRNDEGFSLVRCRDMTKYTQESQTFSEFKYEDESEDEVQVKEVPCRKECGNKKNSCGQGNEKNGSQDKEESHPSSNRDSARKRDFDGSPPRASKKRAWF